MSSTVGRPGSLTGRALEAAGGFLWLAAVATIAVTPSDVPSGADGRVVFLALAAGGVMCAVGLAGWRWTSLGRGGRAALVIASGGGVAVALGGGIAVEGPWLLVILGFFAILGGTIAVAAGVARGQDRKPAVGTVLLVGAVASLAIFAGAPSFAAAFGFGHVAAAAIGPDPIGHRRSWTALARAGAAALAVIVASATLASGGLLPRDRVTSAVRTGPLPPIAIVVDTDMLPDDWLALIYLASEPDVEIRMVTVSSSAAVGCPSGVAIARDLLAGVGRPDVPVACGPAASPGGIPFPAEWGDENRAVAASIGWTADDGDPPGAPIPTGDAVALLRSAVDGGPITIVSLGPPTNVARLLDDPTWDRVNVERIVQMAGAVDVPGNVEPLPSVEWNAAVDPAALATVLASDIEVVLVSLDGTNHVPVRPADIDRLTAARSTPAAALAAAVLDSQRAFAQSGGYYTWDVLAAVTARQPDVVRAEWIPLRVSRAEGEAGRTVRDAAGDRVLVTVDADAPGFERIFLHALLGRAH